MHMSKIQFWTCLLEMYIMISQKSEEIVMEHIYNENMIYGHERNNHELDAYEEQTAVVKILWVYRILLTSTEKIGRGWNWGNHRKRNWWTCFWNKTC